MNLQKTEVMTLDQRRLARDARSEGQQYLTFILDGEHYGVDILLLDVDRLLGVEEMFTLEAPRLVETPQLAHA